MSNFVNDLTAITNNKGNLYPMPLNADPTRWVSKDDWNGYGNAMVDLRGAIIAGLGHGFTRQAAAPTATFGAAQDFLWMRNDGLLFVRTGGAGGVDTGFGGVTKLSAAYAAAASSVDATMALVPVGSGGGGGVTIKDAAASVGNMFGCTTNAGTVVFSVTSSGANAPVFDSISGALSVATGVASTLVVGRIATGFTTTLNGGLIYNSKEVSGSASVTVNDYITEVATTGGPVTLTLPAGVSGQTFIFKDSRGTWQTNSFILKTGVGGDKIDGVDRSVTGQSFITQYGWVAVTYLATIGWMITGQGPPGAGGGGTQTLQQTYALGTTITETNALGAVIFNDAPTPVVAGAFQVNANNGTTAYLQVQATKTLVAGALDTVTATALNLGNVNSTGVVLGKLAAPTNVVGKLLIGTLGIDNNAAAALIVGGTNMTALNIVGGMQYTPTSVTGATYTALATDYILHVNRAGTVAITLPTGTAGTTYIIKDTSGNASSQTNWITITPAAGNIDGYSKYVIAQSFGYVVLEYNATASKWHAVASGPGAAGPYSIGNLTSTIVDKSNFTLATTTAATGGAQVQNSPAIVFGGQGWTGAATQAVYVSMQCRPVGNAGAGDLVFGYSSGVNDPLEIVSLQSPGVLLWANNISTGIYRTNAADGGGNVAHAFDTVSTWVGAGAKIVDFRTGNSSKAYVDVTGKVFTNAIGPFTNTSGINLAGGLVLQRVSTGINYTGLKTDFIIETTAAGITVTLPNAPPAGTAVAIKETFGSTTSVIKTGAAGVKLDNVDRGTTGKTIAVAYGSAIVEFDGTNWWSLYDGTVAAGGGGGGATPGQASLGFSATPAFNFGAGSTTCPSEIIFGALTANVTGPTIANGTVGGQVGSILFIQDATGGRTVSGWGTNVRLDRFNVHTGANARTLLTLMWDNTNSIWQEIGSNGSSILVSDDTNILGAGGFCASLVSQDQTFQPIRIGNDPGTLAVTSSGATVTGTGTAFTAINVGQIIQILGVNYIISAYTSATSITITPVYAGITNASVSNWNTLAFPDLTVVAPATRTYSVSSKVRGIINAAVSVRADFAIAVDGVVQFPQGPPQMGTVAVTNGGATVTGTGTWFTPDMKGRTIQITGSNGNTGNYTVSATVGVGATTMTISPVYAGATEGGLTWSLAPVHGSLFSTAYTEVAFMSQIFMTRGTHTVRLVWKQNISSASAIQLDGNYNTGNAYASREITVLI